MAKTVRLKDIAEKIGVSTVTVSKALSGQKGMSDELREKIHALANEMGYIPSISRKVDIFSKSYTIGLLISEDNMTEYSSYYTKMHQKVSQIAMEMGCFTMLEVVSEQSEKKKNYPRIIADKKVDGIIVIGRLSGDYLTSIRENFSIPMIYLDFCNHTGDEDAVVADSFHGAYLLTNHLFDMGHTSIAFVGTIMAEGNITDRYLGYVKSLLEHSHPVRKDWVIPDRDLSTGEMDYNRFFKLPDEMPSAFFCNCDVSASMLIKRLNEKGYKVPDDISVAGYDNYIFPGLCDIKLTTFEVDTYEMGRNAIYNLIRKIGGERYRQGVMILEGHMVLGDSVKDLNA